MPKQKTVSTPGFIVACMNCHGGIGTLAYTPAEAEKLATTHLYGGGDKDHSGHEMTITPTKIVRLKK
jgi:hypothetical protein